MNRIKFFVTAFFLAVLVANAEWKDDRIDSELAREIVSGQSTSSGSGSTSAGTNNVMQAGDGAGGFLATPIVYDPSSGTLRATNSGPLQWVAGSVIGYQHEVDRARHAFYSASGGGGVLFDFSSGNISRMRWGHNFSSSDFRTDDVWDGASTRYTVSSGNYSILYRENSQILFGASPSGNYLSGIGQTDVIGTTNNWKFYTQFGSPLSTLTYSGSNVTWDVRMSQVATMTATNNVVIGNPVNAVPGFFYTLKIKNDATGNRTVSWGTAFKWPGNIVPTQTTNSSAWDIYSFQCDDATNMNAAVPLQNFQ